MWQLQMGGMDPQYCSVMLLSAVRASCGGVGHVISCHTTPPRDRRTAQDRTGLID